MTESGILHIKTAFNWLLQLGRRLVPRSEPPQLKKVHDEVAEQASREEEELAYYFMPWLYFWQLLCVADDNMLSSV